MKNDINSPRHFTSCGALKKNGNVYGALFNCGDRILFQQHKINTKGGSEYIHKWVDMQDFRTITEEKYIQFWKRDFIAV